MMDNLKPSNCTFNMPVQISIIFLKETNCPVQTKNFFFFAKIWSINSPTNED